MPLTPSQYATKLLASLGAVATVASDDRSAEQLWAQSGGQWLTGARAQPGLACAAPVAAAMQGAWLAMQSINKGALKDNTQAHQLLGERAAISGLCRRGGMSAGGACRFYPTLDGFLALNLARADDHELLPAWLSQDLQSTDDLSQAIATQASQPLIERARLLGLAVAPWLPPPATACEWFAAYPLAAPCVRGRPPRVVDLSSLWAGPLCGSLLADSGARVIKVESSQRPDGARQGPAEFYNLLHHNKQSVALNFKTSQGQSQLQQLLNWADIVIEASRPRALQQLGIHAQAMVRDRAQQPGEPGKVWLSITGYGRTEPGSQWIAYGDEAAVAAGLSWLCTGPNGPPVFCADAIADPLTGVHAALAALAHWQRGGGVLLDLSLMAVSRYCASLAVADSAELPQMGNYHGFEICAPRARPKVAQAARLGDHTETVMAEVISSALNHKG